MIRLRRESKPILLENKSKWSSGAKKVWMGGTHPVVVQSMTTTDTADADKTLEQIYGLAAAGCEVVRVTVKDPPDAAGMPAIVARSPVPIVADIHFDHKMALAALEAGVAKLRLNPGNITDVAKTREVVKLALDMKTPIRIGVNMGSLVADLEKQYGHTPEAMVKSALRHVEILEDLGHTDIVISLKAHDVPTTIQTRCAARSRPIRSRRSRSAGGSSRRSRSARRASTSRRARRVAAPRSRSSISPVRSRRSHASTRRR